MTGFEDDSFILEAAWFYPGAGEPVSNVVIEVEDGKVTSIRSIRGTNSRLIVIPPLVNAHTHLELSDVPEPFAAEATFPGWIRKVIGHRASREDDRAALVSGVRELEASGTICAYDTIPMDPAGLGPYPITAVDVSPFIEFIGLTDERVTAALDYAATWPRPGLLDNICFSPHAPYSVRLDLLDGLVHRNRPVMMHLGETMEELQLLEHGTGPFAEMLQSFGIWQPGLFPQRSLCDYIDTLAAAPRVLLAHGNYFDNNEIELLASKPHMTVVYCPRTHAHFGHSHHPWKQMMAAGINVALGTDSRASNPDLSVWNEALYLHKTTETSPQVLLEMLTSHGFRAVVDDKDADTSIVEGGSATFTVLESAKPQSDFWTSPFESFAPVDACNDGEWTNRRK